MELIWCIGIFFGVLYWYNHYFFIIKHFCNTPISATAFPFSHNTEKVIYFLLLDRKRRRPALEEDDEIAQKSRSELDAVDPPRKRLDTCRINGTNSPSYGQISEGSPLTPRRQAFK